MGVVYHAVHLLLKREVALKVITPELSADPLFRARFRREAVAAAAIRHPHLLPVYDAGEAEGLLYLTMHYVHGSDLARLFAAGERLELDAVARLMGEIAGALDAAHAAGMVHRDVKPANVLIEGLDDPRHAYLSDFGLVRDVREVTGVTDAGAPLGTIDYAAPEQLCGQEIDRRADVYALGCVLFEALTGRVPFPEATQAAKIAAHLREPPPSTGELRPELPEALDAVVGRALAKDPGDRFATAGELAVAFRAAQGGHPVVSLAVTQPPRGSRGPPAFPSALTGENAAGPFCGRDAPLLRLRERHAVARGGTPQLVLISGEAGIGKTRLAARFAAEAHDDGATVLYGRCDAEPLVPYQPFITAIRRHLAARPGAAHLTDVDELARFIPELRGEPRPADAGLREREGTRYHLFTEVTRLLEAIAASGPVVFVIDDLQWADAATALLLRHVFLELDSTELLVVATARPGERGRVPELDELLSRLHSRPSFAHIVLSGLKEAETAELADAHSDEPVSAAFARHLRDRTGGNPLFIATLLRSLPDMSDKALERIGVPDDAKDMIARRLHTLPEPLPRILGVAAIAGATFRVDVIERVTGEPAEAVIEALEEAADAGLLREVPDAIDRFAFAHALVREALIERQSASRRARLHLRVGQALEALGGAPPAELALHFFEARAVGGAQAAHGHARAAAAEAAESLAYEDAAGHYERALLALDAHGGPVPLKRARVLLELGSVQLRGGSPASRATFAEAAELAAAHRRTDLLAHAALGFAGTYTEAGVVDDDGIALLRRALAALAPEAGTQRVLLMARLAEALQYAGEEQLEAELSGDAVALARRIGDPRVLAAALESLHTARLHVEHLDERLSIGGELLELARGAGDRELEALGVHWRIYDLLELGDVEGAKAAHDELARLAERLRQPLYRHFSVGWEVVWAQMDGRVEDAERLAWRSHRLGLQAQARDAKVIFAAQMFALRRRADRIDELVEQLGRATADAPSLVAFRASLALALIAAGRVDDATEEFERLARDDFAAVAPDMFWFTAMCVLAEVCSRLGDQAHARVLYAKLSPHRERTVQVSQAACWGSAERFLGLLATTLKDWDVAEAHFESALAKNARAGIRPVLPLIWADLAEMLVARGASGDAQRALELLHRVRDTVAALGMHVAAERTQARIDALSAAIRALSG